MPQCVACSQENPDHARFCLACGEALATPRPPQEERRVVSVIFVDLVGFTAQAEKLDVEDIRAILRPYHDSVRREIESFGGVVEKFIGDAVMGVFGAPVAHGDDAERAVRAALVIRDMLGAGDRHIRIAVNTAARLQTAAPVDGIIVGEESYLATRDAIAYEQATPVVAKGKEQPLPAWVALRATTAAGERIPVQASIVGRSNELDLLRVLWRRTAGDRLPHLVSIVGPTGIGKSWLACALGHKACREGFSVLYKRASRLFTDLAQARGEGRLPRLMTTLERTRLLIIDDWGPEPLRTAS